MTIDNNYDVKENNNYFEYINKVKAFTPKSIPRSIIENFQKECVLDSSPTSPLTFKSVSNHFKTTYSFVSYINKSLGVAASKGLISESQLKEQQKKIFRSMIVPGAKMQKKHFKSLPLTFKVEYLALNPENVLIYLEAVSTDEKKPLIMELAKLGYSMPLLKYVMSLKKSNKLKISVSDVHSILLGWCNTNPIEMNSILWNYSHISLKFPLLNFNEKQRVALLKTRSVVPDDIKDLMETLNISSSSSKLELLRYHLYIHTEDMLYKIENFDDLSSEQKYQLYREVLALKPRLISSWRAAFLSSTRQNLAESKQLIGMLMAYDTIKDEAVAQDAVVNQLLENDSRNLINIEMSDFLKSMINGKPFMERKELMLWLASVLDDLQLCDILNAETCGELTAAILSLSKISPRLRYLLSAVIFNPNNIEKLSNGFVSPLDLALHALSLNPKKFGFINGFEPSQREFAISTIFLLCLNPSISVETRNSVLNEIMLASSSGDAYCKLQATYALMNLHDASLLDAVRVEGHPVVDVFISVMEKYLSINIEDPKHFIDEYSRTFGSYRIPEALIVYLECLQELPGVEKKAVIDSINTFVSDVFSGEVKEKRYRSDNSPHIQFLLSLDEELMAKWRENNIHGKLSDFIDHPLRETLSGCTVTETDDASDVFLCTTEVCGSCLSVRGNSVDNKSFIAYPLDGKIKLYSIKNSTGEMIGRAVLRLLVDMNNEPVLLLDTFFTSLPYDEGKMNNPSPYEQSEQAIIEAVKHKAAYLNIPLLKTFSAFDNEHLVYDTPIISLGGPSYYECVNAVGAQGDDELCLNSKYKIHKAQVLYDPDS